MTDVDAEEFDRFIERHWGKESVYKVEEYKEEKKHEAANAITHKRGRKPKLATEN